MSPRTWAIRHQFEHDRVICHAADGHIDTLRLWYRLLHS